VVFLPSLETPHQQQALVLEQVDFLQLLLFILKLAALFIQVMAIPFSLR